MRISSQVSGVVVVLDRVRSNKMLDQALGLHVLHSKASYPSNNQNHSNLNQVRGRVNSKTRVTTSTPRLDNSLVLKTKAGAKLPGQVFHKHRAPTTSLLFATQRAIQKEIAEEV